MACISSNEGLTDLTFALRQSHTSWIDRAAFLSLIVRGHCCKKDHDLRFKATSYMLSTSLYNRFLRDQMAVKQITFLFHVAILIFISSENNCNGFLVKTHHPSLQLLSMHKQGNTFSWMIIFRDLRYYDTAFSAYIISKLSLQSTQFNQIIIFSSSSARMQPFMQIDFD